MKRTCKLCNGRGKQKNSLSCNCCKGKGFLDLTGKIVKQCRSCQGTGRATIRTLPCISCSGNGFSVLSEVVKKSLPKREEKETRPVEQESYELNRGPLQAEARSFCQPDSKLPDGTPFHGCHEAKASFALKNAPPCTEVHGFHNLRFSNEKKPSEEEIPQEERVEEEIAPEERPAEAPSEQEVSETETPVRVEENKECESSMEETFKAETNEEIGEKTETKESTEQKTVQLSGETENRIETKELQLGVTQQDREILEALKTGKQGSLLDGSKKKKRSRKAKKFSE